MIAKGTPHRDGAVLARYLVTGKERERAELWELRGFACTGIVPAFRSVHVMAAATRCLAPFFHVSIRNADGDNLDRTQWQFVADSVERMLGLTDQPRAVAFHIAEDTGLAHMHVAWSRINSETLTAKPLPFFKQRLKQVCRELEGRFGLTAVPNKRRSSIRFAPTRFEEEQARRLSVDVHAVRESIKKCFERSDCGRSFRDALAQDGLLLAQGDRRDFLVVDRAGGMHALGKRIVGISASQIRNRLADLSRDALPTLEQLRSSVAARGPAVPHDNAAATAQQEPIRHQKDGTNRRPRVRGEKSRAAGKEAHSEPVAVEPGSVTVHFPRNQMPPCPQAIRLPVDAGRPSIEERAQQCSSAATNQECTIELLKNTGAQQYNQPSPYEDASKSASIGEPVERQARPFVHKTDRSITQIKGQFRALVKQLTTRAPAPSSSRKRRREENGGAFRAAAKSLLRWAARVPPFHFLDPSWEPFTWLRLWEYNDPAGMDLYNDCLVSSTNQSLHL